MLYTILNNFEKKKNVVQKKKKKRRAKQYLPYFALLPPI